jgi:hypothetical protein
LAAQDFAKCVDSYPKDSPSLTISYYHFAKTLLALKQNNKAIDNLQKALDLNSRIGGLAPFEANQAQGLLVKLSQEQKRVAITK